MPVGTAPTQMQVKRLFLLQSQVAASDRPSHARFPPSVWKRARVLAPALEGPGHSELGAAGTAGPGIAAVQPQLPDSSLINEGAFAKPDLAYQASDEPSGSRACRSLHRALKNHEPRVNAVAVLGKIAQEIAGKQDILSELRAYSYMHHGNAEQIRPASQAKLS